MKRKGRVRLQLNYSNDQTPSSQHRSKSNITSGNDHASNNNNNNTAFPPTPISAVDHNTTTISAQRPPYSASAAAAAAPWHTHYYSSDLLSPALQLKYSKWHQQNTLQPAPLSLSSSTSHHALTCRASNMITSSTVAPPSGSTHTTCPSTPILPTRTNSLIAFSRPPQQYPSSPASARSPYPPLPSDEMLKRKRRQSDAYVRYPPIMSMVSSDSRSYNVGTKNNTNVNNSTSASTNITFAVDQTVAPSYTFNCMHSRSNVDVHRADTASTPALSDLIPSSKICIPPYFQGGSTTMEPPTPFSCSCAGAHRVPTSTYLSNSSSASVLHTSDIKSLCGPPIRRHSGIDFYQKYIDQQYLRYNYGGIGGDPTAAAPQKRHSQKCTCKGSRTCIGNLNNAKRLRSVGACSSNDAVIDREKGAASFSTAPYSTPTLPISSPFVPPLQPPSYTDFSSDYTNNNSTYANPPYRPPSSASLLSAPSTVSTIASTSAQSSYAYLFDTARYGRTQSSDQARRQDNTSSGPVKYLLQVGKTLLTSTTGVMAVIGSVDQATTGDNSLLPPNEDTRLVASPHQYGEDEYQESRYIISREIKVLLRSTLPLLVGNGIKALGFGSHVASSGHLGRDELAGYGLAHTIVVITGYPVAFSALNALETCASQVAMSNKPQLTGGYLLRAIQAQWIAGIPLFALWVYLPDVLKSIMNEGMGPAIDASKDYLIWYFVPFMIFANNLSTRQVLYAQGITWPLPYLSFLEISTLLFFLWLFVWSPSNNMGLRGMAVASGASNIVTSVSILLLIARASKIKVWGGFRVRAPWRPFLKLLGPSFVLALLSMGINELITLAATQLGTNCLASQAVLSAISRMTIITSSSIGVASLNRVGNLIGARTSRGACISSYVSIAAGMLMFMLCIIVTNVFKDFWVGMITSDPEVKNTTLRVLPIASVSFAFQGLAFVGSSLITAQGRQALAVQIRILTLYSVSVPLGYYFLFVRTFDDPVDGLIGLWLAVTLGQASSAIVEIAFILYSRWNALIESCSNSFVRSAS